MNPIRPTSWLTATLLLTCLPAFAQTIPNPSFELDSFSNFPGYVSGNAPVTGWIGNYVARHGINPGGGSPFADNGTIPAGSQVGFIQNEGFDSKMETTISGLTAGQTYQLAFRANARNGNVPILNLSVDGTLLVNAEVRAVGGNNPYRWISAYFTATGTEAPLTVANVAGSDNTLLIDDFTVTATSQPWSSTPWVDASTSGLDSAFTYTHAYSFGSANSFALAGVPVTGIAGGNPTVAGKLALSGFDGVFTNDGNSLNDESRPLANDFIYNGFPGSITLSGLTPNAQYQLSLFTVGWEGVGARQISFRNGDKLLTIDQNANGNNNGNRIDYSYTADGTGSVNIMTHPLAGNSFHLYGLANRGLTPPVSPIITIQPKRTLGLIDQTVTLSASAAGAAPLTFKWFRNGTEIPGETGNTLSIAVTDAVSQSGDYTFRATNNAGSATSNPAFLEVYQTIPDALFGTGVDATGTPLGTGELDPHYSLFVNPDNIDVPDAFVQGSIPSVWLANSASSVWIGPRTNTGGAAGPDPTLYVYRTTFDLTGKGTSAKLSGGFASDNTGTLKINGVTVPDVGQATNFGTLTTFSFNTDVLPPGTVTSGVNNLDFEVNNAGAGPTGLRVDKLSISQVPASTPPVFITQPAGGAVVSGTTITLNSEAYGTADLAYQWSKNGLPIAGETNRNLTISNFAPANNGSYSVRVTSPAGNKTSNTATLTASNVPPTITASPASTQAITGRSLTLTVSAEGSLPFAYQWSNANGPIPGATSATYTFNPVTHAASGKYKVRISNGFGSPATSSEAIIRVYDPVPGAFNTGVDDTGAALADGEYDNHYIMAVNPGFEDGLPSVVHGSNIFPIVNGPWLANNAGSKWISNQFNSATSAGLATGNGTYYYRTTVDLSGFYLPSVQISGGRAQDNVGVNILVNGSPTVPASGTQFNVLDTFTLTPANAAFTAGPNTIDFVVQNVDGNTGYTGLRIDNMRAFGTLLPPMPPLTITLNASGQPVISFTGTAGTSYPIQRSTDLDMGWSVLSTIVAGAGGSVSYTDTSAPAGRAFYRTAVPVPAP